MELLFDKGTVIFDGTSKIPGAIFDERIKKYRAEALYYSEIKQFLKKSNLSFEDNILNLIPCPYY